MWWGEHYVEAEWGERTGYSPYPKDPVEPPWDCYLIYEVHYESIGSFGTTPGFWEQNHGGHIEKHCECLEKRPADEMMHTGYSAGGAAHIFRDKQKTSLWYCFDCKHPDSDCKRRCKIGYQTKSIKRELERIQEGSSVQPWKDGDSPNMGRAAWRAVNTILTDLENTDPKWTSCNFDYVVP